MTAGVSGQRLRAAGIASGLAGLATFLVLHAIWITPIWNILVVGVLISGFGGWLAIRCYGYASRLANGRLGSYGLVFAGVSLTLVPSVVLTIVLPPLLETENGEIVRPLNVSWLVSGFFVNLLIPTFLAGAAMGWLLTKRRTTAALFGGMGLLMGLGPGHNIPLFGAATAAQWGMVLALTFVPMAAAAVVLVEGVALASRDRQPAGSPRTP